MKCLRIIPAMALLLMLAAAGCGRSARDKSDVQTLMRNRKKTWDAMRTVMARHFLIKTADRSKGMIEAAPLRNDGRMAQAETRILAKIFSSPRGGYDVEVLASNYINVSEPYALSKKLPRYQWAVVSFDQRLQTQLLNEIDKLRFEGRMAAYDNKFLESPREAAYAPPAN